MSPNYDVYCLLKALEDGRQRICELAHSMNNLGPLGIPRAYNHSPSLGATISAVIYISVVVLCSHLVVGFRDTLQLPAGCFSPLFPHPHLVCQAPDRYHVRLVVSIPSTTDKSGLEQVLALSWNIGTR